MRIETAKKVHYDSGPNMTPLVDVVMVILIFLMLTGSFGGLEHYLVSNVPYKKTGGTGGQTPPKGFIPDEPLDLRVDQVPDGAGGDRWVATVVSSRRQTSDKDALVQELTQMRQKLNAAGHADDRIQVVISPGLFVKYQYLISVYESAMQAGYKKIGFATHH